MCVSPYGTGAWALWAMAACWVKKCFAPGVVSAFSTRKPKNKLNAFLSVQVFFFCLLLWLSTHKQT
jgi:hypothetical protein